MFTKEELLEKGVPEEAADEIIAGFSEPVEEDSLSALQKALGDDPVMDDLIKAEKGEKEDEDEDEEKEEYDEKFMKKMKKYMKECDGSGKLMKKAVDDFDNDAEGAVIEMSDLNPLLSEFSRQADFNEEMVKAISILSEQMEIISQKSDKSYGLMQKAAKLQVEQAQGMNEALSVPQGRKGVIASSEMAKATDGAQFSPADSNLIYESLLKATKNGDREAGYVISALDVARKDVNRLSPEHKKFISGIISKEAN